MVNVSGAFLQKLYNDERNYLEKIDMTLADGTILNLKGADIWQGSFSIDDAVGDDNTFSAVGSAIINSCRFTLNNIYETYNDYDFKDAVAVVSVGLPNCLNGEPEYVNKGIFVVDEAKYNGATISLTLYDNMHRFDVPYSLTNTTYEANLITIVNDICQLPEIDVSLAANSAAFPRYNLIIDERPTDQSITCREVISWVAMIAGCYARINVNGELEFKWFDTDSFENVDSLDGGIFDAESESAYTTGDIADGGSFNPWDTGYEFDSGTFSDIPPIHNIYGLFSQDVDMDDIVITKVTLKTKVDETPEEESEQEDEGESESESEEESEESIVYTEGYASYSVGTDGYEILMENNQFITPSNMVFIASCLAVQLIGLRFRRINVSHLSNPTIEAGDIAYVWDGKGHMYSILVTRTNLTVGGQQTTVCGADTPARNSVARYTEATKSYTEMRKYIAKTKADLQDKINNANGLYAHPDEQPDGSVIYYLHDKPELSNSDIQIMISTVGITVTSNGTSQNPDWYGLTVDGQAILSILNAYGVNANWINTGTLTVKDDNGNVVFQVVADPNADNMGYVRIVATELSIKVGNVLVDMAQTTQDVDGLKMHYRFDEDGETIGNTDSEKSIKLSNDGIDMMVDGESVTRWNQDEMYTPRKITVPVSGSLQLGDFIFQPRSSGNMSLFFIGD